MPVEETFLGLRRSEEVKLDRESDDTVEIHHFKFGQGWAKRIQRKTSIRQMFTIGSSILPVPATPNGDIVSQLQDSFQMNKVQNKENGAVPQVLQECPDHFQSNNNQNTAQSSRKRGNGLLRTLHSMTNFQSRTAIKPAQETQMEEAPQYTYDKIHQDMSTLREKMCHLNKNGTVTKGRGNMCDTDYEWIEDTIRDITKKGMEVMEESACTHITTTIGCDQKKLETREKQAGASQLAPQTRLGGGEDESNCYQPAMPPSSDKKKRSPKKTPQNTSEDISGTTQPTQLDIISTRHLAATKQRVEGLVRESAVPARKTKRTPKTNKDAQPAMRLGDDDRRDKLMEQKSQTTNREELALGHTPATAILQTMPVDLGAPRGIRMPGSYPDILEDGEGIDDRSGDYTKMAISTLDIREKPDHGNLLQENDGVFYALLKQVVFLFKLYWKIVGPVFDPQSVYWQRQARQEATSLDSIVLVMALPGAILATAAVTWGMRLAAIAGVYIRSAVGTLEGDMLYIYGG